MTLLLRFNQTVASIFRLLQSTVVFFWYASGMLLGFFWDFSPWYGEPEGVDDIQ